MMTVNSTQQGILNLYSLLIKRLTNIHLVKLLMNKYKFKYRKTLRN